MCLCPEPMIVKLWGLTAFEEGLHLLKCRILLVLRANTQERALVIDWVAVWHFPLPIGWDVNLVIETLGIAALLWTGYAFVIPVLGPHSVQQFLAKNARFFVAFLGGIE